MLPKSVKGRHAVDAKLVSLIDTFGPRLMDYGLRLIGALAIFLLGKLAIRLLLRFLEGAMRRAHFDETLVSFSTNMLNLGMLFLILMASANTIGVPTTSFLTVVGAAGLAIGLALKGSLDNVASGIMVVALRQIHVGDYIQIDGHEGFVETIRVFNTTLRTRDNKTVILPNSQFGSQTVINYSTRRVLRVSLVFSVSYEDDIARAKAVMHQVMAANPRVLKDPEPFVGVRAMNDSSIDFDVFAWVQVQDYWAVQWELTEAAKLELEAAGLTIPFPQRDVHFYPAAPESRESA